MSAFVLYALASLFTAQELDAVAGGRLETSAGQVPQPGTTGAVAPDGTMIDPPSLSTLAVEASPNVAGILTLRSARITLEYSPRIYYRFPLEEGEEDNEPLVLHRMTMTYAHSLARDLGLDLSIAGSKGELDYVRATTGDITGTPDPGTVPLDNVISITSLTGAASLTKNFGASETLEFEIRPMYTKPETGTSTAPVSTTQIRTTADITYTNSFSSRDELQLVLGADVLDLDASGSAMGMPMADGRIYTARTSARLEHDFNRSFSAHALGGLAASFDELSVLPIAELGVNYDIYRRGNLHLATALSAGLDTFVSPLLGTFDGRLVSSFTFTVEIGSRIDILASASFFTTITAPDPNIMATSGVTESVLQGRLPISYRVDEDLSFEIGLRTSLRGPRLSDDNFRLAQPEFVGYASITGTIDTRVPEFVR